jgi:saccharopine dehydrogenase-like NADP-dependent oxidoreductase
MVEKTLRYPGHARLMRVFRDSGFFDAKPIRVGGQSVSPIDLTSKLLVDQWRLKEGEQDLVIMRVIVEGKCGGNAYRYAYELLDRYDVKTQTTSMARTTGYTCAIVARQVLNGLFAQRGICPPEYVGRIPACYENLMLEYAKRHIHVTETISRMEGGKAVG